MKEFKFNFLNGFYLVSVNDDKHETENLQALVSVQNVLRSILPHREREIDSFILSCVNDFVNRVTSEK